MKDTNKFSKEEMTKVYKRPSAKELESHQGPVQEEIKDRFERERLENIKKAKLRQEETDRLSFKEMRKKDKIFKKRKSSPRSFELDNDIYEEDSYQEAKSKKKSCLGLGCGFGFFLVLVALASVILAANMVFF